VPGWQVFEQVGISISVTRSPILRMYTQTLSKTESTSKLPRFTIDGSDALERHLAGTCRRVLEEVRSVVAEPALEALILAGGYGRGQGGVMKTEAGDQPYNDLEFYLFVRGNRLWNEQKYRAGLTECARKLAPEAGLHVEFKVDSIDRLRRSAITMFSYDLVARHRIAYGIEAPFRHCEHHLKPETIPLSEATRLLFNRCTGLLLAKELLQKFELAGVRPSAGTATSEGVKGPEYHTPTKLAELTRLKDGRTPLTPGEADFIERNLAKAQLALGDAVLTARGQYHWNCMERHSRLENLTAVDSPPWLARCRNLHRRATEFKLHPARIHRSLAEFRAELGELADLALEVWLWLETRRLNCRFASAREYAFHRATKWPGTSIWKNLLLNVKTFGPNALLDAYAARYPRERLFNALCLLLWDGGTETRRQETRHLQQQLRTNAYDWAGLVTAYKQIWHSYG
jgi:hypothetical protein